MQSMHVESSRVWVWQRWSHVDDILHRRSAEEVRMKPIPEDASRRGNGHLRAGQTRRFPPKRAWNGGWGAPPPRKRNTEWLSACVAKKTLMRVIDEDIAIHGVVMVMVSVHWAGMSCGVAKLWLNCHYSSTTRATLPLLQGMCHTRPNGS